MTVTEQDVLDVLRQIETGEVTLTAQIDPQIQTKGDIPYKASNGWTIEVSNWSGEFSGIGKIILPDGTILDDEFLDKHMPNVQLYFPEKEVEWRCYGMKPIIVGYIYRPIDKIGLFENCQDGQIISTAERKPPYIIVNDSLETTLAANWPGKLLLAQVLDPLEPQDHSGPYTRCFSVKLVWEMKTERLFGEHGSKIETVIHYASRLEASHVLRLAKSRSGGGRAITSEGWHRWMAEREVFDRDPDRDMGGVVNLGNRSKKSPIGDGLSLIHRKVWESALREIGDAAFEEDEEEKWLIPPWSDAVGALMEAAWGLGAPHLFSAAEIETLLKGWSQREPMGALNGDK
ncbi:MAG: hypothetical protein ABJN69_08140 [Hellea sp.]